MIHVNNFRHPSLGRLDLAHGKDPRPLANEGAQVFALSYSPTDKLLASSFGDGSIRIYNVFDRTRIATVGGPAVTEIDDDSLITQRSSTEKPPSTLRSVCIIDDNIDTVTSLKFKPVQIGHDLLIAVDTGGCILHWGGPNYRTLNQIRKPAIKALYACDWVSDASKYAVGGQSQQVRLYDSQSQQLTTTLESAGVASLGKADSSRIAGHSNRITNICCVPNAPELLLSAGWDECVLLWDLRIGKVVRSLTKVLASALAVSPDGKSFSTGSVGLVQSWSFDDFKQTSQFKLVNEAMTVNSLCFDRLGRLVYSAGTPGEVGIVSGISSLAKVTESATSPFSGNLWAVTAANRSNLVACGSTTGYISLFDCK